jgi:hypothetical protein
MSIAHAIVPSPAIQRFDDLYDPTPTATLAQLDILAEEALP